MVFFATFVATFLADNLRVVAFLSAGFFLGLISSLKEVISTVSSLGTGKGFR